MPAPRDTFAACGALQRDGIALATRMKYCIGTPTRPLPNTPPDEVKGRFP